MIPFVSDTAFWLLVGVVIGWHVPQPDWAKFLWSKLFSVKSE